MANLIPDHLGERATQGEKAFAKLLSGLPDDCTVYYEPKYRSKRPDFVVLSPRLGMIVIEAKGWQAGNIVSADRSEVCTNYWGKMRKHNHPIDQARGYRLDLLDFCKEHPKLRSVLVKENGKLRFPIGEAVVLPQMRRKHLERAGLAEIFPECETISAELAESWKTLRGRELEQALRPYFPTKFLFEPLDTGAMDRIRAAINPAREVPQLRFETGPDSNEDSEVNAEHRDIIHYLDDKQEDAAVGLGSGHRILLGVAGSGKTLVLQARARYLAKANPEAKILLLCYNRTLAGWLRYQLRDVADNVEVKNFHAFASSFGCGWTTSDNALGDKFMKKLESGSPDYDAVLIDEGQDFAESWFRCAVTALKDRENSDLIIAIDGAQGLYKRKGFTWVSVGIKASGRVETKRLGLNRNYRNTRPIVRAAGAFAATTEDSEESEVSLVVDPELSVTPGGLPPVIVLGENRHEEAREVYRMVKGALSGNWHGQKVAPLKPEEIGILYPPFKKDNAEGCELQAWISAMVDGLKTLAPTVWLSAKKRRGSIDPRDRAAERGIKVQTIHSAKGLQYRAVIVLWGDLLPSNGADPRREIQDRRLLYVAMTRAESLLAVTQSRPSRYVDEIEEANARQGEVALPS